MRDRDEQVATLCMTFKLTHSEGRMLALLLANDFTTVEELRAAAAAPDKKLAYSTMRVFLCGLRKKLALHNIKINTIVKLGYGVDATSRAKIHNGVPARPRNPEPSMMPDAS